MSKAESRERNRHERELEQLRALAGSRGFTLEPANIFAIVRFRLRRLSDGGVFTLPASVGPPVETFGEGETWHILARLPVVEGAQ